MVLLNLLVLGLSCLFAHACAAHLLPHWLEKPQSPKPVPSKFAGDIQQSIHNRSWREDDASGKTLEKYTAYDDLLTTCSIEGIVSRIPDIHQLLSGIKEFQSELSTSPIWLCDSTIFRHDPTKEFIVAFPGTQSKKDAHADQEIKLVPFVTIGVTKKNCKGCKVHQGFYREWQSISESVSTAIRYHHKMNPSYKIVVTGHSLGASLASLCTASLRAQGLKLKTFTFGEPRTGNKAYANHIDKISGATAKKAGRYYRVTHANDGVPKFPDRSLGYQHSRTEYWETNTPSGGQSAATTFRCFGQEPDNCNNGTKGKVGVNAAHGEYSGLHYNGDEACGV